MQCHEPLMNNRVVPCGRSKCLIWRPVGSAARNSVIEPHYANRAIFVHDRMDIDISIAAIEEATWKVSEVGLRCDNKFQSCGVKFGLAYKSAAAGHGIVCRER